MKNKLLLFLLVFFINCLTVSAQQWLWGQDGGPGLKSNVESGGVATNRTGNVYHCGSFAGMFIFGALILSTPTDDAYLVKYDQNGNLLWARQSLSYSINSSGSFNFVSAYSVASDDSDNAYITGSYNGSITAFARDSLFSTDTINTYLPFPFLVKYDHNGKVVWAKQSGNGSGAGLSVAADKLGRHEYVTGFTMSVDSRGADIFHIFLTKYDRNGNMVWTVKPDSFYNLLDDSTNAEAGTSVAIDISGNVYVAGEFQDSLNFGNYKLYSANPGVFIAKFDSNGNVLWAQQSTNNPATSLSLYDIFYLYYGPNVVTPDQLREGYSVTVDQSGAAYLTGPFTISLTLGYYNFTVKQNNRDDFFLVKYHPNGTIDWGEEATPLDDSSSWISSSISSDDSNHIYIVGVDYFSIASEVSGYILGVQNKGAFEFGNETLRFTGNNLNVMTGNNSIQQGLGGPIPAFLLKLDSAGTTICGSTLLNGGYDDLYHTLKPIFNADLSVASDSTGRFVYIGGPLSDRPLVLGPDILTPSNADWGDEMAYTGRWQGCECNLVISGTPLQTICSGHTAILSASGATSYTWSPAATLSSSTGDSVVADPVVTTTYTITGINSFTGCEATVIDTIYVLEGVNIPIITQDGNVLISSSTNDNQWFRNDSILTGETGRTDTALIGGWYKVEAINPSNGCNTVSDSIYVKASGIAQLSINGDQLSIYPNPTTGEVVLTISPSAEDVKDWNLQIDDVLGQTVYIRPSLSYSNDIDLSGLPGGVYFITVINKMGRTVVPVLKQ